MRLLSAGTFQEGNSLSEFQMVRFAHLIGLEDSELVLGSLKNLVPR